MVEEYESEEAYRVMEQNVEYWAAGHTADVPLDEYLERLMGEDPVDTAVVTDMTMLGYKLGANASYEERGEELYQEILDASPDDYTFFGVEPERVEEAFMEGFGFAQYVTE